MFIFLDKYTHATILQYKNDILYKYENVACCLAPQLLRKTE